MPVEVVHVASFPRRLALPALPSGRESVRWFYSLASQLEYAITVEALGCVCCACVGREDFDLIVVMLLERKQLLEMIGFVLDIVGSEVDGGLQCRVAAVVALGVSRARVCAWNRLQV